MNLHPTSKPAFTSQTRRRMLWSATGRPGLIALSSAFVLAACGTNQAGPAGQPGAGAGAGAGGSSQTGKAARPNVTLEYWSRWGPPTSDVEERRVAEWMTANGPTKIERTTMTGNYIEKLNTAFAVGTGPDVYTVGGSGIPNFSAKGAALTIAGAPAVQKEIADFFPATIEASKYQGKLNGLPYIVDVRAMIFRKDLMQQAGLDPSKFPETWDTFRDAARRMTKRQGQEFTQVGFDVPKSGWSAHDLFLVLIEQQGEHPFNADLTKPTFTGAAGQKALQLMVDLVNKDQVDTFNQPKPPQGTNGLVAGIQASTWNSAGPVNNARRSAPEVLPRIGVAAIPMLKQRFTYMGGTYLMASSKPKDATAAIDFMLYLTASKHADEINSIQNAVPPRKSAANSEYVKDPLIKPFYEAVQYGWSYPNHGFYTEIREAIVKEVEAAIKQEKSVQAALDDAARGAQEFLSKK